MAPASARLLPPTGADLRQPPRQRALHPAGPPQRPGTPQLRPIEPLDDDFRATGQPGQWVEIARVQDQYAGDQLVEAEAPAAIQRHPVPGQTPAGVKWPAINDHAT